MSTHPSRRTALKTIALGAAALAIKTTGLQADQPERTISIKGNIHQSVCRWCFNDIPMEDFCKAVKGMGLGAIDLVGPKDWPLLQQYGLYSSMCNGAEINLIQGWNNPLYHETLLKNYLDMIPLVGKAGYKNLICFSGNRNGMDDETGLKNCADGLKKIMSAAEKHGVIVAMELFNSKVDHKDYMCDKSAWGVELVKRVDSPHFSLLYDIYHMQINEGDVIRTIRDNHQYFAHYHTAGVPGRHEIDESQELYYPAIMRAIFETGFQGYVAQEFIPTASDKLGSLKKAVEICDV